jgi:long-subunit acyl-CoA synthetase (AMP-forming)
MHSKKLHLKDRHVQGIASLRTLFEQVQQHARERPNHVAVWNRLPGGQYEAMSYSELAKAARCFAHAFADNLSETRFVALCLARSTSCIAAMLGAIGAGKGFICLHQKMRLRQVSDILEATRAPVVLVDAAGLMTLRGRLTDASAITRVRWWLLRGPEFGATPGEIAARLSEVAVVEKWEADVAEPNVSAPLLLPDDPLRVGCCIFTSGSTGKSKGVLISERDLTARAWAGAISDVRGLFTGIIELVAARRHPRRRL